jgi:hypothetical protein
MGSQLTPEEFEQAANSFIADMDRNHLIETPGVRQILTEVWNNEIIEYFEQSWEPPVQLDYIDMCYPDFLTNHFNGEKEMLLQAYPSSDDDDIISGFVESVETFHHKLPDSISTLDIKRAITRFVEDLQPETKFDPNLEEDSEVYLYASMDWE